VAAVAADQADRLELLRGSCARDGGWRGAHRQVEGAERWWWRR
jgi:hypothetical protein